jgi:RNA polymerase sigma-70 factor (ECF subfamily)
MLGDRGDAEDVVQEAFTRLLRTDVDELDDVRAWLVTVVSRLCLDQLRSARRQRQEPLDAPAVEPDRGPEPSAPPDPGSSSTSTGSRTPSGSHLSPPPSGADAGM